MKIILTTSLQKMSSDFKRQPGSFPDENNPDQSSLFEQKNNDVPSLINKWKKNKKAPTERVYQYGIDVPSVEKN